MLFYLRMIQVVIMTVYYTVVVCVWILWSVRRDPLRARILPKSYWAP